MKHFLWPKILLKFHFQSKYTLLYTVLARGWLVSHVISSQSVTNIQAIAKPHFFFFSQRNDNDNLSKRRRRRFFHKRRSTHESHRRFFRRRFSHRQSLPPSFIRFLFFFRTSLYIFRFSFSSYDSFLLVSLELFCTSNSRDEFDDAVTKFKEWEREPQPNEIDENNKFNLRQSIAWDTAFFTSPGNLCIIIIIIRVKQF